MWVLHKRDSFFHFKTGEAADWVQVRDHHVQIQQRLRTGYPGVNLTLFFFVSKDNLLQKFSGLYYKSFTIVIYGHDDIGRNYKTTITILSYAPNLALALASVINYDHKWRHNLKHHLLTIKMCL